MKNIYSYLKQIFHNKKNLIVFELGVHIGQDTEKLIKQLNINKYFGFECDPRNIKVLKKKNIDKHINLIEKAISKDSGVANFYKSNGKSKNSKRNNTASSSLFEPATELYKRWSWIFFESAILVETISLDDFCNNLDIKYINFIWCDIQGGEHDMILGGQNILKNTKYLYTEYSDAELYIGQKKLNDILNALPGDWNIIKDFKSDVLLENKMVRI